jgi:Family of unknown function (DUF6152)
MKKRTLTLSVVACAGLMTIAVPAFAHHSFAMFDPDKVYVWEGTVKEFTWTNPHARITIVVPQGVKDPRTVGTWEVEGAAPNIMGRQGWNRNTYKEGDKIVVVGQPMRDGSKAGSIYYALKDGKRLYHDVNRNGGPGSNGKGVPTGVQLP